MCEQSTEKFAGGHRAWGQHRQEPLPLPGLRVVGGAGPRGEDPTAGESENEDKTQGPVFPPFCFSWCCLLAKPNWKPQAEASLGPRLGDRGGHFSEGAWDCSGHLIPASLGSLWFPGRKGQGDP